MGNLFTTSKKHKGPAITDTDRAILSLKTQRKRLSDQQKLLELRIDRHVEVAKQLLHEKKKDRAMLALKKKKLTEKQLEQLGGLLLNLDSLLSNIEIAKQQNKLYSVLQQGNDALKQLQQQVSIEDVQKLMDDTAEAKAYQDELNAVLGQSLTSVDEDAVALELEVLEAQELDAEVLEMPQVPATKVPMAQAKEEDIVSQLPNVPQQSAMPAEEASSSAEERKVEEPLAAS